MALRYGQQRILEDSRVSRLVERQDVDVVALIFLNDVLCILVGVERVHEDERHVDVIGAVEIFDLAHREIKEGHTLAYLDDGLWTDTSHGGTETTVEFEDRELVEEFN